MHSYLRILFFTLLCSFSTPLESVAQLKADFDADTLEFCPPLAVKFKDKSTGGRITSRQWTFGQGGSSNSNDPFPSATYSTSGNYTVTLTVGDGTSTATVTKNAYIKAFNIPRVNFTTPQNRKGCTPLAISYTDRTIQGSAPISSFTWNLGNGTRSSVQNPSIIYGLPGKYTITLSVTDTNGCLGTEKKLAFIEAVPGAVASFSTAGPHSSCQGPHTVNFISTATGLAPLTHFWDFGNGNTSIQANPTETFPIGNYDITYVVRDASGCVDSSKIKRFVSVGKTTADFSTLSDTFCLSDSNPIQFTNLSVGASSYTWLLGNGAFRNARDILYNYPQTGTYNVTLQVKDGAACSDQITKNITIIQPTASFSSDIDYWCNDTTIQLTPNTDYPSKASSIIWGIMHELDTVVRNYGKYSIFKNKVGQHTDTMTVLYSSWGTCSAKVHKPTIRIWKPSGFPNLSAFEGCVPLIMNATHNISPLDSLQNGVWKFSDGRTVTGPTATDTITTPGKKTVTFFIEHKRGCKYKHGPLEYKAGTKPTVDFVVDTPAFCAEEKVHFRNRTIDSSKVDYYRWDLNYPNNDIDTARHPERVYPDTGFRSVRLVAGYFGCKDTLIKTNMFEILGPTGDFDARINCLFPFDREFVPVGWVDVQRFNYDFGDFFGYDSSNQFTAYNYASRGDFFAKLTLFNDTNNCTMEKEIPIFIRDIQLQTTQSKSKACFPDVFVFNAASSQDVERIEVHMNNTTYFPRGLGVNIETTLKGAQAPMIIGTDINGCADTNYHWLKTYKPEAKIVTSGDTGCGPLSVQFMDSTLYDTTASIRNWTITPFGQTNQISPTRTFSWPGVYISVLEVEDVFGCRDTINKNILVRQPIPQIAVDTQICLGTPVNFSNIGARPNETYLWSFDDTLTDTVVAPQVTYSKKGRKTIRLVATDAFGCDSVVEKPLWVDVQEVNPANVIALPNDTFCYPAEIDFKDLTVDTNVRYRYWRFDSSETFFRLSGTDAFYNYVKPGKYGVDLVIETTYGCIDTFRFDSILNVGGPYAEFDIMDTVCLFAEVGIELQKPYEVFEYRMDFGDGIIDTLPGKIDSIFYNYSNPGFFPVNLIFTDSLKQCVKSWSDSVFVLDVIADILSTDSFGCAPFQLQAQAQNTNANEYKWTVNDSLIQNGQNFSNVFTNEGQYKLKLIPKNVAHGCTDSTIWNFEVFQKPELITTGGGNFCDKDSVSVRVSGADFYKWIPNTYLSNDSTDSVLVKPSEDIEYTVYGVTKYGCRDTTSVAYEVVYAPEKIGFEDTTIFTGQTIQLNKTDDPSLNYRWEPPLFLSCFNCANPEIDAQRQITYTLNVTDQFDCFEYDTSFTVYLNNDHSIIMPNAFSPNGDDLNETFKFYTNGIEELLFFGIFNRWGEEVYRFNGLDDEWDGYYRGNPWPTNSKLVYKGQFKKYDSEVIELTGFIVIVR